MAFQVMSKCGDTFPDTSETDPVRPEGPKHPSQKAAEAWMKREGLETTANREYYKEYWVEEVQ
ncbi:MAG: hypothetical protein CMP23_08165 [Rickettsiales bacterium]|nr:hypothetical protein [Rickettsiales bacterium]|tara:strand:+ start:288 stop:476 length:189 start_codon:yes stop_codon:yes gene_type:complete